MNGISVEALNQTKRAQQKNFVGKIFPCLFMEFSRKKTAAHGHVSQMSN